MRTNKTSLRVALTASERSKLEHLSRSFVAPYRTVLRARIILLVAQGLSISAIARQVGLQRRIIRKWAERFIERRLAGLEDAPRSGRPARFSPRGRYSPHQVGLRAA